MKVFSIPLRTRFRGITVREGVLVRGRRRAGASSARSWSTTPRRPRPGWPAPARRPTSAGPSPVRWSVPVNVTVPACSPEQARAIVLASAGCRTAKVKVAEPGQPPGEDEARLEAVRDALGPDGAGPHRRQRRLVGRRGGRADPGAGAGGRGTGVRRAAGRLGRGPRRRYGVGSTCRSRPTSRSAGPSDPYRVRDLEAADIAVLKVQPLGGVRACLRIAEDIGLPVVVSSARRVERSASPPGSRSRRRCPSCPTRAGWRPCSCSPTTWSADPLLPVDGALPVRRPSRRPGAPGAARRPRRTGRSTGGAGWPRSRPCGRIVARDGLDGARHLAGRPARGARDDRRGAVPRVAQRAARPSRSRPTSGSGCTPGSTSAPPAFLALGLAKGIAPPGRGRHDVGHRGGQPASGRPRGRPCRRTPRRRHRRPPRPPARHRRQPDHRPGAPLRRRGLLRRPRRPVRRRLRRRLAPRRPGPPQLPVRRAADPGAG